MKKLIALILALLMVFSLGAVSAFAAPPVKFPPDVRIGIDNAADLNENVPMTPKFRTVSHSYETFAYTQETSPIAGLGTFSITRGDLVQGDTRIPIFLIAIHGTEGSALGQVADTESCIQSGTDQDSAYLEDLLKTINENIPKGSNLVFAGHSLGGMVAQQAAADDAIKNDYNVVAVVTFGSPLLAKGKTEGQVNRLAASGDIVPYLSLETLKDFDAQIDTRSRENVASLPLISHVIGYWDDNAWKDYDALGVKGGNAVLEMDDSTTRHFYAPKEGKTPDKSLYFAVNILGNWYGFSYLS